MKTVRFEIDGMRCDGCADRLRRVLDDARGVHSVDVSFEDRLAEITFNDRAVKADELVSAVAGAGFEVSRRYS